MSKKIFFGLVMGVLFFIFISCEDVKVADYTTNPANKSILKSSGDEPPQARVYRSTSNIYLNQNQLNDVIKEYKRVFDAIFSTDNNTQAKAYRNEGDKYLEENEFGKAIVAYTQAIELYNDNEKKASMYYKRAHVYFFNIKDYKNAIKDCEKVIEISKDDVLKRIARYSMAYVYILLNNPEGHRIIGNKYFEENNFGKAIVAYTQAIGLYKDNKQKASMYYAIGIAYFEQKDYKNAITNFMETMRLSAPPTNDLDRISSTYYALALVYFEQENYEKAIEACTNVIDLSIYLGSDLLSSAYYTRGLTYFEQKDYGKAIQDYMDAIRISTDSAFKVRVRDMKEQAYKAYIRLNKAEAYRRIGDMHLDQDEFDDAIKAYTKAIRLYQDEDKQKASAYYSRGIAYSKKKDYKKAIEDYTEAIRISIDDAFKAKVRDAKAQAYNLQATLHRENGHL